MICLAPALVLLGIYLGYPLVRSMARSLFDASGATFVGLRNYADVFTDPFSLRAFRNNFLWLAVAPATVTSLGLVFAVLIDRVRWATALRLVLILPMTISLFVSGVVFRLVYEQDPDLGLANAAAVTVHDALRPASPYPGVRPRPTTGLAATPDGFTTTGTYRPGEVIDLPLVGMAPRQLPAAATVATPARPYESALTGVAWLDVPAGQPQHRGMPGIAVEAVRDGVVIATVTTGEDGAFALADLPPGEYSITLPESNFNPPFRGLTWLGPTLITPLIILAWIWLTTGFAVLFIGAGLAAIPRDLVEAAKVDGATEWQILRRVLLPLLAPALLVVMVTSSITVLKVFELVFVMAPGPTQADANVLALQMWQVSFGQGNAGLGSALSVILFLLVVPAMLLNIRRFRKVNR